MTNLDVSFVPDVVVARSLFHNVLLRQDPKEVTHLLEILQIEGLQAPNVENATFPNDDGGHLLEVFNSSIEKRMALGAYIVKRRDLDGHVGIYPHSFAATWV